jgi:hypothetical protein
MLRDRVLHRQPPRQRQLHLAPDPCALPDLGVIPLALHDVRRPVRRRRNPLGLLEEERLDQHEAPDLVRMDAAREDPLRESAQRALINVHLAEGNTGEAVRQLRRCEQLFDRELGLRPSRRLTDLVRDVVSGT